MATLTAEDRDAWRVPLMACPNTVRDSAEDSGSRHFWEQSEVGYRPHYLFARSVNPLNLV
jgi:hypothetical protein